MKVERMTRERFWSLDEADRRQWQARLYARWHVDLNDVREFWFEGRRIVGVEVMKRNEQGRFYANGHDPATEYLGKIPRL